MTEIAKITALKTTPIPLFLIQIRKRMKHKIMRIQSKNLTQPSTKEEVEDLQSLAGMKSYLAKADILINEINKARYFKFHTSHRPMNTW